MKCHCGGEAAAGGRYPDGLCVVHAEAWLVTCIKQGRELLPETVLNAIRKHGDSCQCFTCFNARRVGLMPNRTLEVAMEPAVAQSLSDDAALRSLQEALRESRSEVGRLEQHIRRIEDSDTESEIRLKAMLKAQEPKGPMDALARKIGALVEEKHEKYGRSYEKTPLIMRILYPEGIQVDAFPNALGIVRTLDKLCRIASGNDGAYGESAWDDVMGYGALGAALSKGLIGVEKFLADAGIKIGGGGHEERFSGAPKP